MISFTGTINLCMNNCYKENKKCISASSLRLFVLLCLLIGLYDISTLILSRNLSKDMFVCLFIYFRAGYGRMVSEAGVGEFEENHSISTHI
jgi:hypothetical protein